MRELILLEKLPPGTPVPERKLADSFGISRTPLKEALRTLEIEGLIEFSPSRRPRIANPSLAQIADNLLVLATLEGLAGELACQKSTPDEIATVERFCNRMRTNSDTAPPLEFFRWDMEFHSQIVASSKNDSLIGTHRQYNARSWRARFISSRLRTGRENTLRQHDDIVAALKSRNERATRRALRAHLETAIDNIATARKLASGEGT